MDTNDKEAVAARSGTAAKAVEDKATVDPKSGSAQKVADSTVKAVGQGKTSASGEIDYTASIPDNERDARIRENIENAMSATSHPAVKKLLTNALKDLDARAAK